MLSRKKRKLTFAAVATLAMACSPAYATTTTITIGVAANFSTTLNAIINSFSSYYSGTYTYKFVTVVDSTTNLKNAIISGAGAGPYDLFLSADFAAPQQLYTSYSSLVVGSPFQYATGSLVLWSGATNHVDISGGLPSPLTTNFVLADPTKAPYGKAASQVLSSAPWSIPTSTTYPSGYAQTRPNINTTYAAVKDGTFPYGFVAKSAVCTKPSTTEVWYDSTHTSHHEYLYNDAAHPYDQIKQYGVKVVKSRTADQETELTNFLNFLTGVGTTLGTAKIQYYCYQLP
ncbi:molybdate ABC transporter substrate-binding protein [Methylocella silvestris]|nr:molybdate ABC transporter substrate-binding protein [Methylocella silvestris]